MWLFAHTLRYPAKVFKDTMKLHKQALWLCGMCQFPSPVPQPWIESPRHHPRRHRGQPIDFIANLQFLRSVEVYHHGITDLAPLTDLQNVEVLGLQTPNAKGLENWQPPLRVLLARWCKQLVPMLSTETLEHLNITNYPYKDLQPLELPQLRRLFLTSRNLKTLSGSEIMPKLEHVDLYNCPNLESVEELSKAVAMKTLEVEACRHVSKNRSVTNFDQ